MSEFSGSRRRYLGTLGSMVLASAAGCIRLRNQDTTAGPTDDPNSDRTDNESPDAGVESVNESWPQFMYNSRNSGWNPDVSGPTNPTDLVWEYQSDANVDVPLSLADGTLFFGEWSDQLYALDATTGEERWLQSLAGSIIYSAPAVERGLVVIGTDEGEIFALDTEDGAIEWAFQDANNIAASPTIHDGTVFISDSRGTLYGIGLGNGTEQWRYETDENTVSVAAPAVTGSLAIFGSTTFRSGLPTDQGYLYSKDTIGSIDREETTGTLHAVDIESGSERWTFDVEQGVLSSPSIDRQKAYVGGFDGRVYAITIESGGQEWVFETDNVIFSTPAVTDNHAYVTSTDKHIYAVNKDSGEKDWLFPTNGRITASPVVTNEAVFLHSHDQQVYALDRDGTQMWTHDLDSTSDGTPVVTDRLLFIPTKGPDASGGTNPGRVLAIGNTG